MICMDVIGKINELKADYGWSDYTLADKAGVSSSTIANMNRRKTVPSVATLEKICGAFGMTLSQFFDDGAGKELPLTKQEASIIAEWRRLDDGQKKAVRSVMKEFNK